MKHFFDKGILPELVGKFYSRPTTMNPFPQVPSLSAPPSDPSGEEVEAAYKYCYCHEDKEGEMIGCNNPQCHYEWFHFSCLKLSSKPKSTLWYCPDCTKLPQFRRKTSKKKQKLWSLVGQAKCTFLLIILICFYHFHSNKNYRNTNIVEWSAQHSYMKYCCLVVRAIRW